MKEKVIIEKFDDECKGIAYLNNKITFIENALPKEIVNISIIKEEKDFIEAKVIEYLETSKERKTPSCPHFGVCGGCDCQHISYEKELEIKENKIRRLFKNKYSISNIIPSELMYNYRNKITLKVIDGKIGFYEKNSHNLINIDYCYLVNNSINKIIEALNHINLNGINEITIRSNEESMLIINGKITNKMDFINIDVDNIIVNNNSHFEVLKGTNYINELLNTISYRITLDSFFQINKMQTINLYNKIIEIANFKKSDSVLDLYCGTGSISLYIASYVKKVIGIEINKNAISSAIKNKELNNINNVEFICENANQANKNTKADIIIVDPPRNGLDKKTITNIKNYLPQKLVYISCNPHTLSRDISLFNDIYEVKEIIPIDMFPRTVHVECVTLMTKK